MNTLYSLICHDHDGWLLVLAVATCLLGSTVTMSLLHHARTTAGKARPLWLALGALAGGCAIWATHFIAMLAYDPGVGTGYLPGLTLMSLAIAILGTGCGIGLGANADSKAHVISGGLVVGLAIAAMHYLGMAAVVIPGELHWHSTLVLLSIAISFIMSLAAFAVASRQYSLLGTALSSLLLAIAILMHHIVAMAAITVTPNLSLYVATSGMSSASLALLVAIAAAGILGICIVATLLDVQAEGHLRKKGQQLDAAVQNIRQGLCMFDMDGKILLANRQFARIVGKSIETLEGKTLACILQGAKEASAGNGVLEPSIVQILRNSGNGQPGTRTLETPKGRSLRISEQPMTGGGWITMIEDITNQLEAEEKISFLTCHDQITLLPNRAHFSALLDAALTKLEGDEALAILYLDIDNFSGVNDAFGYAVGNDLLRHVAARLRACLSDGEEVARVGGDEFAILTRRPRTQTGMIGALADHIAKTLSGTCVLNGVQTPIGLCIGICIAPEDGSDSESLLKHAAMALDQAKADGLGACRFFLPSMDSERQARCRLEIAMRAALENGEFEIYYQPINDALTSEIIGFEALLRWNHPIHGMISPATFIPIAEETGLIVPIGEWVLHRACQDAAGWTHKVRVAVNLSPVQFKGRELSGIVVSALAKSNLPADRLELEITESVLMLDNDVSIHALRRLRQIGVHLAMDDFGTGFSSLNYLRNFPFNKIKIDQCFVRDLATKGDARAIVHAICVLARSLGISTTAEGVETDEQLDLIKQAGCSEVQGYLFSKPRPASDVEAMLSVGHRSQAA